MSALALDSPRGASALAAYCALFRLAFRQRIAEPAELLASAAYYVLTLWVFARLYEVLLAGAAGSTGGVREYVWYIAITEGILCAMPRFHLDIEQDVRLGDIAYQLTRPTAYLGFRLSVAAAQLCANLLLLGAIGWTVGVALVGPPADARVLVAAVLLVPLASLLWLLCTAIVGLSAFWVDDTQPIYWMFQKSAFVLGGLFVPLHLYPDWLREIALALPFSALLYAPARMVFGADARVGLLTLVQLLLWCGLTALLLRFVYARAQRTLDLHGG